MHPLQLTLNAQRLCVNPDMSGVLCTAMLRGTYTDVNEMEFLPEVTGAFNVCVHFYHQARPARYCSPRHPSHFEPSFLQSHGTLCRGEQYLPRPIARHVVETLSEPFFR